MGEYADMEFDRGLDEWFDEGCPTPYDYYPEAKTKWHKFNYKNIIAVTEKAFYLEMSGGAKTWFPKSQSVIDRVEKNIFISNWLYEKMMSEI